MNLLAWVLAGHFIGDWLVQTDWQAANKVRQSQMVHGIGKPTWDRYLTSWRAMAYHMVGYHLVLAIALLLAVGPHGLILGRVMILLVSLVTHAFIDRRWPVRWLMEHTGSAAFADTSWGVMVTDQALHLSILCLLVGVIGHG